MRRNGIVYIVCNTYNNVIYVGVTSSLGRRIAEHKAKINRGFTSKYKCDKLVYFEVFDLVIDAIAREKQIKNWKREWKNELISRENPNWSDLSESIGITQEMVDEIKELSKNSGGFYGDYDYDDQ